MRTTASPALRRAGAAAAGAARRTQFTGALVPMVLEQSSRGERVYDIYSRLLRERIVMMHGPVTEEMSSLITAQLLYLEADDPEKPISMYINSPGGIVTGGLAIYDTMQARPRAPTRAARCACAMSRATLERGPF